MIQPVAADCLSGVLGDNSQICAEQDSCKVDSLSGLSVTGYK